MNLRRERPFIVVNQDYINNCESGNYTLEFLTPKGEIFSTNAMIVNSILYRENNYGEIRPLRITDRTEHDTKWRLTYNGPWVEDCADIDKYENFLNDFSQLGSPSREDFKKNWWRI